MIEIDLEDGSEGSKKLKELAVVGVRRIRRLAAEEYMLLFEGDHWAGPYRISSISARYRDVIAEYWPEFFL